MVSSFSLVFSPETFVFDGPRLLFLRVHPKLTRCLAVSSVRSSRFFVFCFVQDFQLGVLRVLETRAGQSNVRGPAVVTNRSARSLSRRTHERSAKPISSLSRAKLNSELVVNSLFASIENDYVLYTSKKGKECLMFVFAFAFVFVSMKSRHRVKTKVWIAFTGYMFTWPFVSWWLLSRTVCC